MMRHRLAEATALLLLFGCGDPAPRPLLTELPGAGGIAFRHQAGGAGNRELPETMGGGVAVLDADGDGDLDIYAVQSGPVRTPAGDEDRAGAENELWANDGTAAFTKVASAGGADDRGYGQGVAVGDVNGDGRDDLVVLNWGPNALYVQGADGFRREPTEVFELDNWSVSAAVFDADADGDLDLFEVNYLRCPPASHLLEGVNPDAPGPFASYPHPDRFRGEPDRLLLNDGAGRFRDATAGSGADGEPGKGLGVVPTDADLDGLVDLYVTNDSTPNHFLRSLGGARFERADPGVGLAFNDDGLTEAGMGVDTADVDGDLDLDLFCTNLDLETNTLYLNQGGDPPRFRDRTRRSGLAEPSRPLVGFGCVFSDFDADGDEDLFVANGHIIDNVASFSDARSFAQSDQLFLGDGAGAFVPAPREAAPELGLATVARGVALGDLDGDGAPDLVVGACGVADPAGRPLRVFLGRPDPTRLRLTLAGPPGNPRGLGSNVWLEAEDGTRRLVRIESTKAYGSASEAAWAGGLVAPLRAIEVQLPGRAPQRFADGVSGRRTLHLELAP